jgi:thiol-disulfide isomerase/thioredoxin
VLGCCVSALGCVPTNSIAAQAIGHPLALQAESLDGATVAIDGPGPVRIIDVWASWCAPCLEAAPRLHALLARHPEVAAISLSVDDDVAELRHFLAEHEVPGKPLHYRGGLAGANQVGIHRIPLFIVVDERGQVIGVAEGSRSFAGQVEQMVSQLAGRRVPERPVTLADCVAIVRQTLQAEVRGDRDAVAALIADGRAEARYAIFRDPSARRRFVAETAGAKGEIPDAAAALKRFDQVSFSELRRGGAVEVLVDGGSVRQPGTLYTATARGFAEEPQQLKFVATAGSLYWVPWGW